MPVLYRDCSACGLWCYGVLLFQIGIDSSSIPYQYATDGYYCPIGSASIYVLSQLLLSVITSL